MLIAGFDVETTGLDTEKDWIIEAAVVLWDTEGKHRKQVLSFESLVKGAHIGKIPEEATAIHGLTLSDCEKWGKPANYILSKLAGLFERADAICAHNGNAFDRPMFESNCRRLGVPFPERPWVDSAGDIPFPAPCKQRSLLYLSAWHGFLNPFPHNACSDVLSMLRIADQYDWKETLAMAKSPSIIVKAGVNFDTKELAKKLAFQWDGTHKIWTKSLKVCQLEGLQKAAHALGFSVIVIKGPNEASQQKKPDTVHPNPAKK